MGKTRLAVELATELVEEFRDGVWFVDLSALRDPELVVPAVAGSLRASVGLTDHVADKNLLLVLDNFEQVVDAAPHTALLLERCPNLQLIVTSREPLHVGGERRYPLRPLSESPAIELFRQRAVAVDPSFDASYDEVAELCRLLDNLPLALELAAARTASLTVPQLLERLRQRLPLLATRARDVPERQRTMRAAIEWSYDLLAPEQQELFGRLSVFAGGFMLEAAEEVVEADIDALQSLVEKSLVRYDGQRFSMLETIRAFAFELLTADENRREIHGAHARHYRDLVFATQPKLVSIAEGSAHAMERLASEVDNIRSGLTFALQCGDANLAADIAPDLFWWRSGALAEAVEWMTRIVREQGLAPAKRARMAHGTARMLGVLGNVEGSRIL
jgi:predicted ATPase